MAGLKDNVVIAVISDLTMEQAAQMTKDIMKAKKKNAPYGRGTIAYAPKSEVGRMLQGGCKKQIGKKGS